VPPGPYHYVEAESAAEPVAHGQRKSSILEARRRLSNEVAA
jgi:hypothetical protein